MCESITTTATINTANQFHFLFKCRGYAPMHFFMFIFCFRFCPSAGVTLQCTFFFFFFFLVLSWKCVTGGYLEIYVVDRCLFIPEFPPVTPPLGNSKQNTGTHHVVLGRRYGRGLRDLRRSFPFGSRTPARNTFPR